jgi:hypothetical protein
VILLIPRESGVASTVYPLVAVLEEWMINVQRTVSYITVALILFLGVLIVAGFGDLLEPRSRIGLGILILFYAGVRLVMLVLQSRRKR